MAVTDAEPFEKHRRQQAGSDLAFANMEKAYEEHRGMQAMTFWGIDPYFAPLYSDPRFDAFLKHAGLPPRPTPTSTKSD